MRADTEVANYFANDMRASMTELESGTGKVIRVLADASLRREFGAAARRKAQRDFDTRKMIRDMLDVYLEEISYRQSKRP